MISFNQLGNMGNIGNQMFQYASLRGIARNNNLDWCVPPKELFGINYPSKNNIYDCFLLQGIESKNIDYKDKNSILNENFYHFDRYLFDNCPDNIDLLGYFQSEKYFKNIEDEIRKDFIFKDNILEEANQKINLLNNEYAFLHVRRTDYLMNAEYHANLDLDYYKNAIDLIPKDINIVVLSDDLEWCSHQELFKDDRFILMNNNAYVDLCIMSKAKYSIIANSSFSWWGAWLNNNKVIAPTKWFGIKNNFDTKDLYLDDWIVI